MALDCGVARAEHWDEAYASRGIVGVSWYQAVPAVSLELVESLGIESDVAVLDVGGGGSTFAGELVRRGFADITVLDFSATALEATKSRLPAGAPVQLVRADLLDWEPDRAYGLWHDRAVFHFLVESGDRLRYLTRMRTALASGGAVIVATFADDGPETCSGLPVLRYSAADLVAELGQGFTRVETTREEHVTPRGAVQPFTWVAGYVPSSGSQPSR
jgi:SAM-dependent methyltransferase